MTPITTLSLSTAESQIAEFFRYSQGQWRSERRYYTLPEGETQELVSLITVRYLDGDSEELLQLAQKHQLNATETLICGATISWDSHNSLSGKPSSAGSTVFGVRGNLLYRDRGFATPKPVTADFYMPNPQTLCLRTEYNGSVFEEELKQIGHKYRTRQTIISRAGEQLMIGQYLEKRLQ